MLSDLRSNLCGIAVDCLTSCDDEIVVNVSQCSCDSCGGSPCICAAEYSVGYKDALVCAHSDCLTEYVCCLGKSHGQNGNFCAKLILQSQCCFQSCLVIRVHDSKHCASVKSSVRIEFNAALCIGHLLNTNNNLHCIFSFILFSFNMV